VQSERLISDALKEFGAGRTIVAIAHRSPVEDADHVVVLDAGRVVEEGKPAELRAMGGLFATLHQLQSHSGQLARPGR
jgi:ABC-type multidrug transport system fused ATPase/permease subunit